MGRLVRPYAHQKVQCQFCARVPQLAARSKASLTLGCQSVCLSATSTHAKMWAVFKLTSNSHKTHLVCNYETLMCWVRLKDGWFINVMKQLKSRSHSVEALERQKRTLIPDWYYIARQLILTVFSCLMVTLVVQASARRKQTFPVPSALIPVTLSAATGPWWDLQANPEPNFSSSSSLDWVAHRSGPLWSSKDPARKPGRHPYNHFVELSEVPWGLHWEDWPWV